MCVSGERGGMWRIFLHATLEINRERRCVEDDCVECVRVGGDFDLRFAPFLTKPCFIPKRLRFDL